MYRILKYLYYLIYFAPFLILTVTASPLFLFVFVIPFYFVLIFFGPLYFFTARITFCFKLRHICRRAKYKCRFKRFWLTSFFRSYEGMDIEIGKRDYVIKFFPGNVNHKGIHLRDLSHVEIIKYFVEPRVRSRTAMMNYGTNPANRVEVSRKKKEVTIAPERGGETILLFSPSPYAITVLHGNKIDPAGNGEELDGVKLYTAQGFLNYMKRSVM